MKPRQHTQAEAVWTKKARRHRARVFPWTQGHRERRGRGDSDPVYDFLFTYYSYRSSQLECWHPGLGVTLRYSDQGPVAAFRRNRRYRIGRRSLFLDPSAFTARERGRFRWILNLLESTAARPPFFGCSGLHEWAMVYRVPAGEIRHERHPLRLSPAEIASVLESNRLACTHFDAFRFFAEEARPRNQFQPERSRMHEFEQGGCLHANMDLYKWSYKLSPWIPSDLVADAFELAREARELDMRASP